MATEYCEAVAGLLRVLSGGTPTAGPPSPPSIVGVTAGDSQIIVRYAAPVSDGGSPITSYSVSVTPGPVMVTGISPLVLSRAVTGLMNGTTYTATVAAVNALGATSSTPSSAVTPTATQAGTGYGGGTPGWAQVKNVTNGVPQGLPGDTRTPVTLATAESAGIFVSSNSYRFTTAHTYDSLIFANQINISATNGPVVFRNCLFKFPLYPSTGPGAPYMVTATTTGSSSPEFYDCEFDGNGTWSTTWAGPAGSQSGNAPNTVFNSTCGSKTVRCYMHNMTTCLGNPGPNLTTGGSPAIIDQCYMDNFILWQDSQGRNSHNDLVHWYLGGSKGCQLTNCYLDLYNYDQNYVGNTSCITNGSAWNSTGVMQDILVDSNYFSHGQYLIRIDIMPSTVTNFVVNGNRFEINPSVAVLPSRDSRITWTNNTYASTGPVHINAQQTINVVAGQLIP